MVGSSLIIIATVLLYASSGVHAAKLTGAQYDSLRKGSKMTFTCSGEFVDNLCQESADFDDKCTPLTGSKIKWTRDAADKKKGEMEITDDITDQMVKVLCGSTEALFVFASSKGGSDCIGPVTSPKEEITKPVCSITQGPKFVTAIGTTGFDTALLPDGKVHQGIWSPTRQDDPYTLKEAIGDEVKIESVLDHSTEVTKFRMYKITFPDKLTDADAFWVRGENDKNYVAQFKTLGKGNYASPLSASGSIIFSCAVASMLVFFLQ